MNIPDFLVGVIAGTIIGFPLGMMFLTYIQRWGKRTAAKEEE